MKAMLKMLSVFSLVCLITVGAYSGQNSEQGITGCNPSATYNGDDPALIELELDSIPVNYADDNTCYYGYDPFTIYTTSVRGDHSNPYPSPFWSGWWYFHD
jgi:hypothetical protein